MIQKRLQIKLPFPWSDWACIPGSSCLIWQLISRSTGLGIQVTPHFYINASVGAKGCLWPGTRGKKEIKLKAQTPALKPVGSSKHSDRPFVVIVLSYPINWLFKHWEVDASCQSTVIPISSVAHICFICIAPVPPQTRRGQLNYD